MVTEALHVAQLRSRLDRYFSPMVIHTLLKLAELFNNLANLDADEDSIVDKFFANADKITVEELNAMTTALKDTHEESGKTYHTIFREIMIDMIQVEIKKQLEAARDAQKVIDEEARKREAIKEEISAVEAQSNKVREAREVEIAAAKRLYEIVYALGESCPEYVSAKKYFDAAGRYTEEQRIKLQDMLTEVERDLQSKKK